MQNEELIMMRRLQAHVQKLAGDIGERNVLRPAALDDAALYVEAEWSRQGYSVKRQTYQAAGVRCANLEVTRNGDARQGEILLIGAHYDSVKGSPGADDKARGVAALMVTDTALYRYPYYHTPLDVPDRLDYASLAGVTQGLFATFVTLGNGPEVP